MSIKNRGALMMMGLVMTSCASVYAQFNNTLVSQKPKPKIIKAEMESDSVHYIDKPNTFRDKKTKIVHSVWTEFDKYKSNSPNDSSHIMYSRVFGISKAWSKSQKISHYAGDCLNGDNTLKSDSPVAGADGELYVCWAGPKGLAFQRSLDSGKTWLKEEKIIAAIKNGWDQQVEGLKTSGVPKMACVSDSGQFKGRIYITWSDEKNGEKNKDVFLIYSDDKGDTWTDPILVTYRPNHKEQFTPEITVQPNTGDLFITYFDRQNYVDGKLSDLYLARSKNGGLKYDYFKLNEKPVMLDSSVLSVRAMAFVPRSNDIKAIWSQTNEDNMLCIYSALINDSTVTEYYKKDSANEIKVEKSVGFSKKMKIDFQMPANANVTAVLTKPLEPGFRQIITKNTPAKAGKNFLVVDTKTLNLKKDNYIVTFYYNNRNSFMWITADK